MSSHQNNRVAYWSLPIGMSAKYDKSFIWRKSKRKVLYVTRGKQKEDFKRFSSAFQRGFLGREVWEAFLRERSYKNQHGTRRCVGALPVCQLNNRMWQCWSTLQEHRHPYGYNTLKRKMIFCYLNQNLNMSHGFWWLEVPEAHHTSPTWFFPYGTLHMSFFIY